MKKYFKYTIITVILLTILISSVHYANHMFIQEIEYTEKWGDALKLEKISQKDKSLISTIGDEIININIENSNTINFKILDTKGKLKRDGSSKLINYENIKVPNIQFIENNLIYIYENDLYVAKFENNKFSKSKKIINNVENMRVESNKDNILITTVNTEKVRVYELHNDEVKNIYEEDNVLNMKEAVYQEHGDNKYIVTLIEDDLGSVRLIMMPVNEKNREAIEISEVDTYSGYTIRDLNVDYLNEKVIITYVLNLSSKGFQSYNIEYSSVDSNTLEVKKGKLEQSQYKIGELESDIETYIKDDQLHIVASGVNYNNKYTQVNDIFDFIIGENGEINDLEFISTTQEYSNEINVVTLDNEIYLSFKDIVSGGYNVNLIGTSDDFMERKDITKDDYIDALLKSIPSPFIALAYTILRGFILLVMLIVPLAFAYVAYLSKNNDKDGIKTAIMIGLYIIANIIAYKFIYYKVGSTFYYPELFHHPLYSYIAPVIINLLSGIALFVFFKESKKKNHEFNYAVFAVFFICIDIYLSNLLYAPFVMVGKLISM
ncbi:hypothetical protein GOQ27_02020 [Clostridium sp. D2Q-11]|uniref:Uncharacterized protein n=1 Tax=Anaeromonas frigoriresistens TaxID=2683708 RepID=A0A942Z654_9FIRM|nr:hypothetical protein [Anaeromonas frigoriresistens]MBS4537217.1 hypothetical protein [Anaeromonas frigoriresistens]